MGLQSMTVGRITKNVIKSIGENREQSMQIKIFKRILLNLIGVRNYN